MGSESDAGFIDAVGAASNVCPSAFFTFADAEKKFVKRVLAFADREVRRLCCFSVERSVVEVREGEEGAMKEAILLGIDDDDGDAVSRDVS